MSKYQIKYLTFTCEKCGIQYTISNNTYYSRKRKQLPNYCLSCMKKFADEKRSNWHDTLNLDEKKEYSEKRNWYIKADEATKKSFIEKMKKIKESRLPEEQAKINQKNSEGLKKHWSSKDEEYRKKRTSPMIEAAKKEKEKVGHEKLSERCKKGYLKIPKEIRDRYSQTMKEYNNNLPLEEKIRRAKNMQRWHKNLTPEQKKEFYERTHQWIKDLDPEEYKEWCLSQGDWYKELSDEEKMKIKQDAIDRYKNLPNEVKKELIKKKLSHRGKNQLENKFIKYFNNSILVKDFKIQSEVLLSNITTHSWDYGIYDKDNNLVMVVDLDGAYFHADDNDYDGLHSKEEYDEKRSQSVLKDIKITIIQEFNFVKCFEQMMKDLMINYDEYIQNIFNQLRLIPFPTPQYTNIELIKSYNKLVKLDCNDKYHKDISLNTRIGDRLITHFHSSIYAANRRGELSPKEAWYNDELLMKCIKNRIIYQNHLNPNKILQGFNIAKYAQKVSVFSAGRAKMLINRYLSEYNEIFDPFSGFSGRMLGTISLGKNYIGQDISLIHTNESNDMIKFLKENGIHCNVSIECKDILASYGSYDCLFTCPPYEDKEQWLEVPVSRNTCDDWIDICLEHFKCKRYLFVVDYTEKYIDKVVDEIRNKSHMNMNSEYVILIER